MKEGVIISKLKDYVKRYHSVQLFKGILLVLLVSALLVFSIGGVEYFFWLNSTGRLLLLLLFGAALVFLLVRYIVFPLVGLFQIGKEWDLEAAAKVIGAHFPEIEDRLLNYLQLHGDRGQSDLLDAALAQKARKLEGIAFVHAVSTRDLRKYSLLLLVPAVLFLALFAAGAWKEWSASYTRVANYQMAYEPPAPFRFILQNEDLEIGSHESLVLEVQTNGSVVPERMNLVYQGKERLLQKEGNRFQILLERPVQEGRFFFQAGRYRSREYNVVVRDIPGIRDFNMVLDYPAYLGKRQEVISGSGNAVVPEGTTVTWQGENGEYRSFGVVLGIKSDTNGKG